jgi:serine/threonine protein phosphatase PrpC
MPENPTPSARAVVVGMTDVGRVREHNEDSFLVMSRVDGRRGKNAERFEASLEGALLLIVCDGMGGAAAGEVASRMAADRMAAELGKADFANSTPDQISSLMDRAVQQANVDIHEAAKANPSQKGMGTTMTAAVVAGGRLYVSQVGDSRAYLLRKGLLNQITKDQSLIGQLIEEGTLTEEEAEKLGGRNIVLQAVGVEENLRVDTKYWPVLRGDVLLVCSDGLSGMVKDARLTEILLMEALDPAKATENLVAEANKNGGRDNVTAIVARFEGDGLRPPMESADGGEVEKAGVAFKAPPPPEMPNPMKKVGLLGLAVLVVIAAVGFALRKTTADITISVKPRDAPVTVELAAAGGKTYHVVATDGEAVIRDVVPSEQEFTLKASAPGFWDEEKKVGIREPGQVQLDVAPIPKPGVVSISSETPRVSLRIEAPGMHPKVAAYDQVQPLPAAGQERTFEHIPAGDVTVTASRDGFAAWTQTQRLASDQRLEFRVPKLAERKGGLMIECPEEGAAVEVFDDQGELLTANERIIDRHASMKLRAGRHRMRVSKIGFAPVDAEVEVAEGKETKKSIALEVEKREVRLAGPANADFVIYRQANSGPDEVGNNAFRTAGVRVYLLVPGDYVVKWSIGKQEQKPVAFTVRVGGAPQEVVLAP